MIGQEFEDEKREIRNSSALLLRQLNDPVPRVMGPSATTAAAEPKYKQHNIKAALNFTNRTRIDLYLKPEKVGLRSVQQPQQTQQRDVRQEHHHRPPAQCCQEH